MPINLAVYRIDRRVYGAPEDSHGVHPYYFVAPAGLDSQTALHQNVSKGFHADQIGALRLMWAMERDSDA